MAVVGATAAGTWPNVGRSALDCSFCGQGGRPLARSPGGRARICEECVRLCRDILADAAPPAGHPPDPHCSFCGRSARDTPRLIAGPAVFICDACTAAAAVCLAGSVRLDASGVCEDDALHDLRSIALDTDC
jgi:ATP-dependent protease Clp ATPase subunit